MLIQQHTALAGALDLLSGVAMQPFALTHRSRSLLSVLALTFSTGLFSGCDPQAQPEGQSSGLGSFEDLGNLEEPASQAEQEPVRADRDEVKVPDDPTDPDLPLFNDLHTKALQFMPPATCTTSEDGLVVRCSAPANAKPMRTYPDVVLKLETVQGIADRAYARLAGRQPESLARYVWSIGQIAASMLYKTQDEVPWMDRVEVHFKNNIGYPASVSNVNTWSILNIGSKYFSEIQPEVFVQEAMGVGVHEATHIYQHSDREGKMNDQGQYPSEAPSWIIEGLADYVRAKSGYDNRKDRRIKSENGNDFTEGYIRTAWFLMWLEERYTDLSYRLNQSMKSQDGNHWSIEKIESMTGRSVPNLWAEYQTWFDGQACRVHSNGTDTCPDEQFCRLFVFDQCGENRSAFGEVIEGHCVNRPEKEECSQIPELVCGCDGRTYNNRCQANRALRTIRHLGPCE